MPTTGARSAPRTGFTLTEVLMAVGILGVGMAMVATIFPVALNQNRRSEEMTRSALCARSMAATVRMLRPEVIRWHHRRPNPGILQITTPGNDLIPEELSIYSPHEFLYRDENTRTYRDMKRWLAGNYTAEVWSYPLDKDSPATGGRGGPWRVTIFVYKAQGKEPADPRYAAADPRAGPGDYIMDRVQNPGYAYMVDWVDDMGTGNVNDDLVYVGSGRTAQGTESVSASGNEAWHHPGAIAVYYTILGD